MTREEYFFKRLLRPWRPLPSFVGVRRSVRGQLMRVVLSTTMIAFLVAGIATLTVDLTQYEKSWASDLSTEASILAVGVAPALAFNDHEAATRNLAALGARPHVTAAALYLTDGRVYASFVREGAGPPPARPPPEGMTTSGQRVEFVHRIERNGEALGTLYMTARYDTLDRAAAYLGIFGLVTLLGLVVAFLLSRRLQRGITEPLDAMAAVARRIVTQRDYSLRVKQTTDNEIGVVVDAFNNMLEEVGTRSRALEDSNRALENSNRALTEEVEVRKSTQSALSLATTRLESTMAAAEIGTWLWDISKNEFSADRNLTALYGLDEGTLDGAPHMHYVHIHPEDLPAVRKAERRALRTGAFAAIEFRVRLANGSDKWMAQRGKVQLDKEGKAILISGLVIDITAQKAAEKALRLADQRKDEFLATLAHELRNPLAPVRHAVKVLESRSLEQAKAQWARDVISRQVQRMALLLDDLLDVSRITQGRLALKIETISLDSIIEAAVETARPLIDAKKHQLTIDLPREPVMLTVDPLRLSQSLSNLLTNGAKYMDEGGQITLRATLLADEFTLSVKDTGIGLEPEALSGLFAMFSQVNSAITRSEGGLGIGLALVKGLIELHSGTIDARSDGPGMGSEFTIHLPAAVVTPSASKTAVEEAPRPSPKDARHRVLVVDDNSDAADSLGMLLEMNGYSVSVGHSGEEALQMARQTRPNAMILDIGMPDMTGYEVARRIRAERWGGEMYLIAATGWGQQEDKARAIASGFDHHLTKPVDPDEVQKLLQAFFSRYLGTG
jgi:PAS domain S-box-containing protein